MVLRPKISLSATLPGVALIETETRICGWVSGCVLAVALLVPPTTVILPKKLAWLPGACARQNETLAEYAQSALLPVVPDILPVLVDNQRKLAVAIALATPGQ